VEVKLIQGKLGEFAELPRGIHEIGLQEFLPSTPSKSSKKWG
jgi:hypothetical protein